MLVAKRAIYSMRRAQIARGLSTRASNILSALDISTTEELSGVYDGQWRGSGDIFSSVCPTTGETLARVRSASSQELHEVLARTREAYTIFRLSLEMGKIKTEGVGEVQEFIDIVRKFSK
ncbi:hypothetical protein DXG03_007976 [Asterophora parasitica]|uniref:Uncharacterized protein n=1 Tax=Asterophora parasitica TaxID=117018 RepID=A0A9P7GCH2_9AGAR|nr:hypothetical protein DXG03_007976 [Asterophora parasitica]